jgi:outer membrane receptor protein involved in Fe transport
VEIGLTGRLADLQAEAAYGYNRHRYLQWVTAIGTDYSGNEMEAGPRHLVNGRLTYRPNAWAHATLTGEWVHVGEYFTDPENRHVYGGYDVVNLFGSAPIVSGVELVARVNNLTDATYASTASFNPFVPVDLQDRFTPALPRSLFLGLQLALGGARGE